MAEQRAERLWTLSEASIVCRMSVYGMRKTLSRKGVSSVVNGNTRNGGRRYAESDLRMAFGARFNPDKEIESSIPHCPICGKCSLDGKINKTFGLCLDCWCRELNKFLIDMRMHIDEAKRMTIESLVSKGVLKRGAVVKYLKKGA